MVSHPQKKTNHPPKKSGDLKMCHTNFAPPTLLRLRFAYMANRAILAASLCQGHQFRRDLRGDLCSAACGSQGMARRFWFLRQNFTWKPCCATHVPKKTIHAVRNDASRHVKFFLFDSLSRVTGVRWPHSMGKKTTHFLTVFLGGPS